MSATDLHVGDTVLWRGGWGQKSPKLAKVTRLERAHSGNGSGVPVPSMPWDQVPTEAVVDLDNGYWAYGDQLAPAPDGPEEAQR